MYPLFIFFSFSFFIFFFFIPTPGQGQQQTYPLSTVTLNLHGLHPTGARPRFYEDHSGKITPAPSHLFYFTEDELARGQQLRLKKLAQHLAHIYPQIIFLQEVAAGSAAGEKTCDQFFSNTATQLANQLRQHHGKNYRAFCACRGNVGWITGKNTFAQQRIITLDQQNRKKEVIFDFGAQPYPQGILVEGLAILVEESLQVDMSGQVLLPVNDRGDKFFLQYLTLHLPQSLAGSSKSPWMVLANIHGGHKLLHFEQAVHVRKFLFHVLKNEKRPISFGGMIIAGDFNSPLFTLEAARTQFEADRSSFDISSIPWEMSSPQHYSSFTDQQWVQQLSQLNFNSSYKPWANIQYPDLYQSIQNSVAELRRVQKEMSDESPWKATFSMQESFHQALQQKLCAPPAPSSHSPLPYTCAPLTYPRIDHIFYSWPLNLKQARIFYPQNNDTDTVDTISDHPMVQADFIQTKNNY